MDTRSPRVHRSPRLLPPLPKEQVELPAPPPLPAAPQMQPLSLLISVVPGLMGALITYLVTRRASYLLFSLPMMLTGMLIQVSLFFVQRQRHQSALRERSKVYRERLAETAALVETWGQQQRAIQLETAVPTHEAIRRVENHDSRLWERRLTDVDFLLLRIGSGTQPSSFQILPPKAYGPGEADPLLAEAVHLAARATQVTDLPVCLPVSSLMAMGMIGERRRVLGGLRALLIQAALHHAPTDLQVAALFPGGEAAEWLALRWLPHTWAEGRQQRLLAATPEAARHLLTYLQTLLQRRRVEQEGEGGALGKTPAPSSRILFVVGANDLAPDHPAWPLLLRHGPSLGLHLLFLSDRREALPADVEAIIAYEADGRTELIRTEPHLSRQAIRPDSVEPAVFDACVRRMAPLQLVDQREGAVPTKVDLLGLFGAEQLANWDLLSTWEGSRPWETLAVPLGLGAGGVPVRLDLHERGDGPHGLAAGATGSGKSELLQTLIAALALRFHPHEVALWLVDYKGGGMANAFAGLPHLTGVITNLEGGHARRALASLRAELKRRQRILAQAGLNHVDAYIRHRRAEPEREPLPHLILIVDEFAELKAEQPEFMRELVSAVRVGRSLGIHLLLATQKPAGVVDEQIWSNARFRLCLRVERREDSMEVLKSPVAATAARPGLCWLQVGSGERMVQFQAGWGGAPYQPDHGTAPPITLDEVSLEGVRLPLLAPPSPEADGPSQLAALVTFIRQGAETAGIRPAPGPWLPPLPEEISLDRLLGAGEREAPAQWRQPLLELNPVIGLVDDPEGQQQPPLRLPLTKLGHLAVVGAPGSGKSTLLQTLVLSLARTLSPRDLHVYLVDGAGRNLVSLAGLPQMGAVILADETERLRRLMRFCQDELARRKEQISLAGAGSWGGYRQICDQPMPALLLCVDNLPALLAIQPDWEELLALLGREGAAFGIYLVVTVPSWNAVRARLMQSIGQAVALALHDRAEYPAVVGRTGGLVPAAVPGRGLIRAEPPLEVQIALPVPGETEWGRQAELQALVGALAAAWTGPRPAPIRSLPAVIGLRALLAEPAPPDMVTSRRTKNAVGRLAPLRPIPVGLDVESLAPFYLDPREGAATLVAGLPGSGKTAMLLSLVGAIAACHAPAESALYLIDLADSGLGALARVAHVRGVATDSAEATSLIEQISEELERRRSAWADGTETETLPHLILAMDDWELVRDQLSSSAKERLEAILRRARGLGAHLLIAGASSALSNGYDALTKALRELQTGFLLGTAEPADGALFGVRLPNPDAGRFLPPGQGFYIRRNRPRAVKGSILQPDGEPIDTWLPVKPVEEGEHESDSGRSRPTAVRGEPVR